MNDKELTTRSSDWLTLHQERYKDRAKSLDTYQVGRDSGFYLLLKYLGKLRNEKIITDDVFKEIIAEAFVEYIQTDMSQRIEMVLGQSKINGYFWKIVR